jgi:hypothetical protein
MKHLLRCLISLFFVTTGCKQKTAACEPTEQTGDLAEPWSTLEIPVPNGALICRPSSSNGRAGGSKLALVVRLDDLSSVLNPVLHRLEREGFKGDSAISPSSTTTKDYAHFRAGLHRMLLGVEIDARMMDGVARINLSTYPACETPKERGPWPLVSSVKAMLAGDDDEEYCLALRSVLSDVEPAPGSEKRSTVTEAPKDLLDAIEVARKIGGKIEVFTPAWGPSKGEPDAWAKTIYQNKLYDGVRERFQKSSPRSPPQVVTVGGTRFGFFSTYGVWIGR